MIEGFVASTNIFRANILDELANPQQLRVTKIIFNYLWGIFL